MLNTINTKGMSVAGLDQSHNIPQLSLNTHLETKQKSYSLWDWFFAKGLILNPSCIVYKSCSRKANPVLTPADHRYPLTKKQVVHMPYYRLCIGNLCVDTWIKNLTQHLYLEVGDSSIFKPQLVCPGTLYHNSCCKYPGVGRPLILFHRNGLVIFCSLPNTTLPGARQGLEVFTYTQKYLLLKWLDATSQINF